MVIFLQWLAITGTQRVTLIPDNWIDWNKVLKEDIIPSSIFVRLWTLFA